MTRRKKPAPAPTVVDGWFDPDCFEPVEPVALRTGIFTDGACQMHNKRHAGGWGVVYVIDDVVVAETHGGEEPTTNNRMELLALHHGLLLAREAGVPVTIYSDSQYALRAADEWGRTWSRRGWLTGAGEQIKNLDLVEPLYRLRLTLPDVRLAWVHGHSGVRWNEYADKLSRLFSTGGSHVEL